MIDTLSTYEAAEEDAVAREDERRQEQHWQDAIDAAGDAVTRYVGTTQRYREQSDAEYHLDITRWILKHIAYENQEFKRLEAFHAEHGTAALLFVLARALEERGE